ncbi:hypothetical protein GCM10027040_23490 [Halomonas shantousis]
MALFRKGDRSRNAQVLETPEYGWIWKPLVALLVIYLLVCLVLGIWWSRTPDEFDVDGAIAEQRGMPLKAVDPAPALAVQDEAVNFTANPDVPPEVDPAEALAMPGADASQLVDPAPALAVQRGVAQVAPEGANDLQREIASESLNPAKALAEQRSVPVVPGEATVATTITLISTLLDKPGGYLRNDVMPPGLWLDNMPSWEYGVLSQVRLTTAVLGDHLAEGTSIVDEAREALSADSERWLFPSAEERYGEAAESLEIYLHQLRAEGGAHATFNNGSEGLVAWLDEVERQLEMQTRQLAANVSDGRGRDAELQAMADASNSWFEIDNVFYEARGNTWALIHLLKAVQQDFAEVLSQESRNTMSQLLAVLEASQARLWSPVVLNGSGFGFFANHSLMMANYTLRATSLVQQLRQQLNAS